jgi:hypothetical protein
MGVGPRESNARGDALIEMETLVVIRENNYWGAGKDEAEAKSNYLKACGRKATGSSVIRSFTGTPEDIERITIDDVDGTISYPKTVTKK